MEYEKLIAACGKMGAEYEKNAALAAFSTMKIGGKCELLIKPKSEEALAEAVKICAEENIPYFVTGRGSNVVFGDFRGVVILTRCVSGIKVEGNSITAAAGEGLVNVCKTALENSLSGMECLYGIPGSVGGALYMNAGAFGGEMKDVVKSAVILDKNGNIRKINVEEMELSYRHSVFQKNKDCVLSVTMELKKGEKQAISDRMEELMKRRRDKQPLDFPSCGSTFKRPQNGFAAALIEECGLKGFSIGNAEVSRKHSGFVINKGGAALEDVKALIEHIKNTVKEQKGVELECEMMIVEN